MPNTPVRAAAEGLPKDDASNEAVPSLLDVHDLIFEARSLTMLVFMAASQADNLTRDAIQTGANEILNRLAKAMEGVDAAHTLQRGGAA